MNKQRALLVVILCVSLAAVVYGASARPHPVHALVHARVMQGPGRVLEDATIVIRDGRIEAVGVGVPVPVDARVYDLKGLTVHAGFIDPYVTVGRLRGKPMRRKAPDDDEDGEKKPDAKKEAPKTSTVSSANPRVHPDLRVADDLAPKADVLEALRAQGIVLVQAVPDSGIFRGTSALCLTRPGSAREAVLKTDAAAVIGFDVSDGEDAKSYPASMMGNVALIRQTLADAAWYEEAWRIENGRPLGDKRPTVDLALAALGPVVHGQLPVLFEATTLLEALRAQRLLDEAGLARRTLVLSGEEWRRLDWMTPLSRASLVLPVAFSAAPKAKSEGEWLDVETLALQRWKCDPANARWLEERKMPFAFTTHRLDEVSDYRKMVARAVSAGLPRDVALAALTTRPASILGVADRYGTIDAGRSASLVVTDGDPLEARTTVREVWIEGVRYPSEEARAKKKVAEKPAPFGASEYSTPPPFPQPLATPSAVLIRNATVWTEGRQGVLEHSDLLAVNGRVTAVGRGLSAPAGAVVIDGSGLHVTPGIIDAHSHTAIDGAVNEGTHAVSAEVRVKDVIDPLTVDIYRQLAGGVTVANVLHGSANAIGGQVVTCRWKWGEGPDALVMSGAPEGIKFALGENPKQSNWGPHDRYPQTRMGVAEIIRERFVAARDYRKAWEEWRAGRRPLPPRKDLQLEALLEVLDGKRLIHCHSYRQDEILMLIRLADEMGFKVKTFQHVLEGYKVADEMSRHGAMASTFSDWWAYKYEVIDAIPWNGAIMHDRGVVVSFNSDSDEQARRLNTEAAKAVRYGSLAEADALAFVTINAARQLGVEGRIGSLEKGKDADFAVWSDHPLSQRAICLQTWIEGRKYFDRAADAQEVARRAAERRALVERAKRAPDEAKEK